MAKREAVTLNETTPQLEVPQVGDTYTFPRAITDDLIFEEAADHSSTPGAGFGYLWVKSDTPNIMVFTDDAGTDWTLNSSGGGGFTSIVDDETYGNYAIGLNALDSLTVGSGLDNIAIGENAGTAITTGDFNILIGTEAGEQVDTESGVVAIGYRAADGSANLTGTVSIGQNANSGAAGSSGIFIGKSAGEGVTTAADGSVVVGANAMSDGNGSGSSVAVGNNSLEDATTGSTANVAVGTAALKVLTSGQRNTAIGTNAADNITTADYGIFIGFVDGLSATDDDQFVVGNGTHNAIAGYFGARSDVDYSGKDLTIQGPSAYPSASTNLDGGTMTVQGGDGASGSAGDADGGNLRLRGGTGYGTGSNGLVLMDSLPTSDPTVAGALWNDSGTLKVSEG